MHILPPRGLSIVVLSLAITGLPGCGEGTPPQVAAGARPVKSMVIDAGDAGSIRQFPGRVDAQRRVDLAFRVSGTLQELNVKEGHDVQAGQVLARLDPRDYETVVAAREATAKGLEADFKRAKELVKKSFLSKSEYDQIEARYRSAAAALKQARLDLSYTVLSAPFDGVIARRHVQNFQEVVAKQTVLALRDLSLLEVKFGVTEAIVQRLNNDDTPIPVTATFSSIPDTPFTLSFREFSGTADESTQTFEATFVMPRPSGVEIRPGMTANVTVDLSAVFGDQQIYLVPVTAVVGDPAGQPIVFVVDGSTQSLSEVGVRVGRMSGNAIEILEGLAPGDRVVTAGTGYLAAGMKVELLPEREQATDNIPRSTPPGARSL